MPPRGVCAQAVPARVVGDESVVAGVFEVGQLCGEYLGGHGPAGDEENNSITLSRFLEINIELVVNTDICDAPFGARHEPNSSPWRVGP